MLLHVIILGDDKMRREFDPKYLSTVQELIS